MKEQKYDRWNYHRLQLILNTVAGVSSTPRFNNISTVLQFLQCISIYQSTNTFNTPV